MWERLAQFWGSGYDLHPSLLVAIGALAAVYLAGWAGASRRGEAGPSSPRVVLFALGIATLVLTLHSPLHHLSDDFLFSAHMAQHLLLTLAVPPLLLLGTTEALLPPALRHPWLGRFGRSQGYALLAFAAFNAPFALVHFPAIYDQLFGAELAHRAAHAVLLGTALLSWMPLLSPVPSLLPRLSQAAQMLYCFVQTLPGTMVGSLLTLSDRVLYRHYGGRPLELGIEPVVDQQLGGLLMWVVGGTYWLVILTAIFFVWADREDRRGFG